MKKEMLNQPQIDLSSTIPVQTENGGDIWKQGFILRKVSRFVTNSNEDAILPIPVFYDSETGKILKDTLPPDIRNDYDTI
jgi:hypothetical protein